MNLHAIASSAVASVNPMIPATIRKSSGTYTTNPDGSRVPAYLDVPASVQMQALTGRDLAKINALNLQGVQRGLYVSGEYQGVVRSRQDGGDLVVINGETFLVTAVLETWPDWSKLAITLQ